jgi:hypothetical protein
MSRDTSTKIVAAGVLLALALGGCAAETSEPSVEEQTAASSEAEQPSPLGEQSKDPNWEENVSLSDSDLGLLRQIGKTAMERRLSQRTLNELTDSLVAIEDQHQYLVAMHDGLPLAEPVREAASGDGERNLLGAGDYPSACYNHAVTYNVQIHTGSVQDAGTDAYVFLQFAGKYRSQAATWIPAELNLNTPADDFERGSTFTKDYTVTSPGELTKVTLRHDNSGSNPGWFVEDVTLYDRCSRRVYATSFSVWLAANKPPIYGTSATRSVSSVSTY